MLSGVDETGMATWRPEEQVTSPSRSWRALPAVADV